ncbi:MAG: helix-turn-helix transcriptional regulator [Lachnospiraceae bacterium]|nr:helix-turn-helix transcriptional regulator [Lachnospiraceae bacterium]
MEFNERLICLRKQKGLSQENLGDEIGVTRQTVSKWELGETTPDMDKLIQLSDLFEISIDELVGKKDCGSKDTSLCLRQRPFVYEYKSEKTFKGIPLVHVHLGIGLCRAKGIIAIGNCATGVLSIGIISAGVLSIGVVSAGLIALGTIATALLIALGGISIGTFALGGIAVGVVTFGGLAIGVYSYGGCAIASHVAKGGYASATVAIGDEANGDYCFDINVKGQGEAIKNAILTAFPKTAKWLVKLFSGR